MKTGGRLTGLEARKTQNALFGFSGIPVVEHLLVGTRGHAHAPAAAALLIDQYDSVFSALVESARRARGHARRIEAVIADPGKVEEHQPLDSRELRALLGGKTFQVRIVFGIDRRTTEVVIPVGAG